jgi:TatD DNase family protein
MSGITDCHCHLDLLENPGEKMARSGIGRFFTSALTDESIERSFRLAEEFPGRVFVTIGVDPTDKETVVDFEKRLETIEKNKEKIVGIGEVGLDFARTTPEERELQKRCFSAFIQLAKKLDLPLIVHSRSAGKYALEQLVSEGTGRAILHAFDGRPFFATEAVRRFPERFFFSIPPSIVRSEQKVGLVKALPLENLLLESDAPSLGPIAAEPNEPANIELAIGKLCEIKKIGREELLVQIEANVKKAYHL